MCVICVFFTIASKFLFFDLMSRSAKFIHNGVIKFIYSSRTLISASEIFSTDCIQTTPQ